MDAQGTAWETRSNHNESCSGVYTMWAPPILFPTVLQKQYAFIFLSVIPSLLALVSTLSSCLVLSLYHLKGGNGKATGSQVRRPGF